MPTTHTSLRYTAMLLWGAIVLILLDTFTGLPAAAVLLGALLTSVTVYIYCEAPRPYDHERDGL